MLMTRINTSALSRRAILGTAAAISTSMLVACGNKDNEAATDVGSTPAETPSDQPDKEPPVDEQPESLDETVPFFYEFNAAKNGVNNHYNIVDETGESFTPADFPYDIRGPISEGLVFVSWFTSEYNEEWGTTTDETYHYGFVDTTTWELAFDITELVNEQWADPSRSINQIAGMHFNEGRAFLNGPGDAYTTYVIDTEGNVVFDTHTAMEASSSYSPNVQDEYRNGIVTAADQDSRECFLDLNGTVTWIDGRVIDPEHYIDSDNVVHDLSGAVTFDPNSLLGSEYAKVTVGSISPDYDGTVSLTVLSAEVEGAKKSGIYDVVNGSWVIEPMLGDPYFEGFDDGITTVEFREDNGEYPEDSVGLLRRDGSWAVAPDTDIDGDVPGSFNHMHDELWVVFCGKTSEENVFDRSYTFNAHDEDPEFVRKPDGCKICRDQNMNDWN